MPKRMYETLKTDGEEVHSVESAAVVILIIILQEATVPRTIFISASLVLNLRQGPPYG